MVNEAHARRQLGRQSRAARRPGTLQLPPI